MPCSALSLITVQWEEFTTNLTVQFLENTVTHFMCPPLPPCALQVHVQGSERTTAEVVYTITCSHALPAKEGESMETRLGYVIAMHEEVVALLSA